MSREVSSETIVKGVRCCKTRKRYSAEEKNRIVLEGLRGEDSLAGSLLPGTRLPLKRRIGLQPRRPHSALGYRHRHPRPSSQSLQISWHLCQGETFKDLLKKCCNFEEQVSCSSSFESNRIEMFPWDEWRVCIDTSI